MRKGSVIITLVILLVALGMGLFFALRRGPAGEGEREGPAGLPTVVAAVGNTCVECHRQIPEGALAGHGFREWEESLHAAQGVSCEACHGGDPTEGERDRAHRGVLSSREPESMVYFKEIPTTCGRCHADELDRFQASVHYRQLEEEGRGPNCVTCHGSMAVSILTPSELQQTCSACHNERLGIRPTEALKARYVLMMSAQVGAYLEAVEELAALKEAAGLEVAAAKPFLTQAEREMAVARREWHAFNVDRIEEGIQQAFAAIREAMGQLRSEGD